MDLSGQHSAGDPLECLSLAIVLNKELDRDQYGNPVLDQDGKKKYRCGFRIGGGIDQDNTKSPQGYPDKCVYITYIHENSPAHQCGLQMHDKVLQVNGIDFTMLTHEKACKYIRKDPVLNMLVYRKGMPQMRNNQSNQQQQQQPQQQYSSSYNSPQHTPKPQYAQSQHMQQYPRY